MATHQGSVQPAANGGAGNGYIPPHDLPAVQPSPHPPRNPYGANPLPGWSQHVGPEHKKPPAVATQLVVPSDLADQPVNLTCYNCQEQITTATRTGPSAMTWAACLCLCCFLCWPCALLPFCCCPKLNVTEHYCEKCDLLLGKYKPWKE